MAEEIVRNHEFRMLIVNEEIRKSGKGHYIPDLKGETLTTTDS